MMDSASFELKTALYIDKTSILANYFFALLQKKSKNHAEYHLYMSIAKKQLDENSGGFLTRLFPLNNNTQKKIYNNIKNFQD